MNINAVTRLKNHPELFILVLIITVVAMLVIPLPTYLVDFLIGLNIVISTLVFLSSFYIDRILTFSSFPAVLLITTLFRLALSISTSRLILNDADAGDIIATFGLFVIGDNLVVGFVIFAIVTIVQFMVITKGAERVAEVAARFSLDGMPGKQMSIDADVRAGTLDAESAAARRVVLEKESQLYGSFDGAMKFIKGDAIAGIIIIFINFIGGISVGVSQYGMDMSTALQTYTMLTIGDGLVAQIPSLLIAVSAGFIVTRVSGEGDNMGVTIVDQLLKNHFVLGIAALLAVGIGTLPGFPFFIFLLLAMLPVSVIVFRSGYLSLFRRHLPRTGESGGDVTTELHPDSHSLPDGESELPVIDNLDSVMSVAVPFILVATPDIHDYLVRHQAAERYRSRFFFDYGITISEIALRSSARQPAGRVTLLINEIRAEEYTIWPDYYRLISGAEEVMALGLDILTDETSAWIKRDDVETVSRLGFATRSAVDELYFCAMNALVQNIREFFGIQETKSELDKLESKFPELTKEVMRHATVQRISEVIQRLVQEKISVRNMKLIMESMAVWAAREKDVVALVEHIRVGQARYISHKFAARNMLRVVLISPDVEDIFRQGIRTTSTGAFLNLEPGVSERLMDLFDSGLNSIMMSPKDYVILSPADIRRFIKRFLETRFRDLEVLSFGEITESVNVDVIKSI